MYKKDKRLLFFHLIILFLIIGITFMYLSKRTVPPFPADSERVPIIEGKGTFNIAQHPAELYISDELRDMPIPTNRIWSSLVFKGNIEVGYFLPFAIDSNEEGIHIGVPTVSANSRVVTGLIGGESLTLNVENENISYANVVEYSDLTVKAVYYSDTDNPLFDLTLIQGSPYIFIESYGKNIEIVGGVYTLSLENQTLSMSRESHSIGVFTDANVEMHMDNRATINTDRNTLITLGLYTDSKSREIIEENSSNRVTGIYANYSINDNSVNLEYDFRIEGSNQTVFGLLPHHLINNPDTFNTIFSIPTIRGIQQFTVVDSVLTTSFERIPMYQELPEQEMNDQQLELVYNALRGDINMTRFEIDGSYFGAKQLARAARLVQIAERIERPNISREKRIDLQRELTRWFTYEHRDTVKHFEYDSKIGGLIARRAEFGSENYNDHHFHYGYFMYAAAVTAQRDKTFLNEYGDFVDLIARDYASWKRGDVSFPYVRVYDWYENHSWASGFQSERDGNNQESTSEAINAWYSLWMWSKVRNNKDMETLSEFLYSTEIATTKMYWLNRNENPQELGLFPNEYQFPKASLLWGGKYEYSTFFSTDPLAIDGIQYLPITPGSMYLYDEEYVTRDKEHIESVLNSVSIDNTWQDINLMYYATQEGINVAPIRRLLTIPIDDGNSRSNLLYWIFYWHNKNN
jgi:endo-1,3(4)-beta-glucanase